MNRFEKWSVWLSGAGTILTGIGYFWTKYLATASEPWAVINHPLQPFFLKAHILISPVLLFAIGLIASRHIWQHYRAKIRWGRKSGIVAVLMTVPMVATGYLIQVLTSPGWLQAMAISHIVFGAVFTVGFILHQIFARPPGRRPWSPSRRQSRGRQEKRPARRPEPRALASVESGPSTSEVESP